MKKIRFDYFDDRKTVEHEKKIILLILPADFDT